MSWFGNVPSGSPGAAAAHVGVDTVWIDGVPYERVGTPKLGMP